MENTFVITDTHAGKIAFWSWGTRFSFEYPNGTLFDTKREAIKQAKKLGGNWKVWQNYGKTNQKIVAEKNPS